MCLRKTECSVKAILEITFVPLNKSSFRFDTRVFEFPFHFHIQSIIIYHPCLQVAVRWFFQHCTMVPLTAGRPWELWCAGWASCWSSRRHPWASLWQCWPPSCTRSPNQQGSSLGTLRPSRLTCTWRGHRWLGSRSRRSCSSWLFLYLFEFTIVKIN